MLSRLEIEIIGALVLLALITGLWIHHDSTEQAKGFASCEAKVTETQDLARKHAAQLSADYELQLIQAKAKSDATPLPATIYSPVLVRVPGTKVCTGTTTSVPQADDVHPNSGGNGPGSGERDIRPGLEAFKVRYGNAFKACQQDLDDWPEPK